jgi:hypothetical protein
LQFLGDAKLPIRLPAPHVNRGRLPDWTAVVPDGKLPNSFEANH